MITSSARWWIPGRAGKGVLATQLQQNFCLSLLARAPIHIDCFWSNEQCAHEMEFGNAVTTTVPNIMG